MPSKPPLKSSESAATIRAARESEAELLTELAMRSKAYWGYDESFMAQCRDELTVTGSELCAFGRICRVCVDRDRIVGFYVLEILDRARASLEMLFVEPGRIGQGYGKRLVSDAKVCAKSRGTAEILIEGDPYADRFYHRVGAEKIGRRPSGSIAGRWLPLYSLVI